jgi:hypothetical protein
MVVLFEHDHIGKAGLIFPDHAVGDAPRRLASLNHCK